MDRKDNRSDYFKKYYLEHKEKMKAQSKEWQKKNKNEHRRIKTEEVEQPKPDDFVIYVRTNTETGMQYVGQTNDFNRREIQWKSNKKYANALIDKDRWNYRFDVEIVARTDTREKAWEIEKRLIEKLGTLYPNGYNIDEGGKLHGGHRHW